MKRIKYSILRRITFAVYFLTTVVFCLYLINLGNEEVIKAKQYTDREKTYVEKLLSCREAMNNTEKAFCTLQESPDRLNIQNFIAQVAVLRHSVSLLTKLEKKRLSRAFMPESKLDSYITLLYSVGNAMIADIERPLPERTLLQYENRAEIANTMDLIRYEFQERLNVELNHVENWQNRSLFFFERLEYLLVSFFVLATLFSLTAFAISGYVLRRYLGFLSMGAKEISSGKLSYRFKDTTTDLVGDVMRDFDSMAVQLQKQTEELESINRELHNKATELEDANIHKDKFLANMSHELRTPLNSIIGFSDLLTAQSKSIKPEKTRAFAQKILSASEHLLELISDLLEIAKVDAGVLIPEPVDFNISNMIKDVVAMLHPLADRKELALNLDIEISPLTVRADRRLIRQLLINIINNALKFTKKGSVSVNISDGGDNVIIKITDTGIGISEKDTILIFKDFHRVEQGLTSNFEGVGLGLTLSKRIIELHKGEIKVESLLKKGSTFTIILPKKYDDSENL